MFKRLAIVGCGGIAATHAFAARTLGPERCQIVALCDNQNERMTDFGRFAPGAFTFDEIAPLLETIQPDALIICTPPATHASLARAGLNRATAILCEKPLAISREDARDLSELAIQSGAMLRTSAKYRFTPGVLKAREFLQNGILGRVERARIVFGVPTAMEGRWQADAAQSGGGVLMDNGPHAVDLARFLFGEVHLDHVELGFGNRYSVEEEASLQLTSETGVPIEVELSWRRNLGPTHLRISGELGTLSANWNSTLWQPENGEPQIIAAQYDKNQAFTRQLETFLADLSTETAPENAALWRNEDGVRAVEVIVAAYGRAQSQLPR